MRIKLVALDLDGTLLDSNGRLPPRNVEAIARVQEQGVGVILATGKTWWSAVDTITALGLTLPSVFSQGMVVRDAMGGIMREIVLDYSLVDAVLAYVESEDLPLIAYNRDGLFTHTADIYHDHIYAKYHEPKARVMGAMAGRAHEMNINKLLIGDREDTRARRHDLETRFGHMATVLQAIPEYIEIMPQGVTKGAGVRWLLERLEIAPEAILAIGDGENDVEMLRLAGLGVAVGSAERAVQEAADVVVGSNDDDGVAEALERFILNGEWQMVGGER